MALSRAATVPAAALAALALVGFFALVSAQGECSDGCIMRTDTGCRCVAACPPERVNGDVYEMSRSRAKATRAAQKLAVGGGASRAAAFSSNDDDGGDDGNSAPPATADDNGGDDSGDDGGDVAAVRSAARATSAKRAAGGAAHGGSKSSDTNAGLCCPVTRSSRRRFSTIAECEAAGGGLAAGRRSAESINPRRYPSLLSDRPGAGSKAAAAKAAKAAVAAASGGGSSSRANGVRVASVCPPDQSAPGCPDTTGYTAWETLFADATDQDEVVVNTTVVLSGCAQPLSTVSVMNLTVAAGATLVITDSKLYLNIGYALKVYGTLIMGTPSCPITSKITVYIPGGQDGMQGVTIYPKTADNPSGGSYDVHAKMDGLTWTRLAATAPKGTKTLSLQQPVTGWRPGDRFVLVSTTWRDEERNQNEVMTIASVSADGLMVYTKAATRYSHYGGPEYQAEVGLLSRRILFTSDADSIESRLGPHTTAFMTPNMRVSGVALERWGAQNMPGNYPLHYHLAGEAADGQAFLRKNAVYNSNWRCNTIHGTNNVVIADTVCFNAFGHGFYLEDGVEERNTLQHNLAAYIHPLFTARGNGFSGEDRWQSDDLFDPTDSAASGFYSLNLYNRWIDNAASGGVAGFTFPRAPRPIKNSRGKMDGSTPKPFPFDPSSRPTLEFRGNSAHSSGYFFEELGACMYFGGAIFYRVDPDDGVEKLYYNPGRGGYTYDKLCPDPNWPSNVDWNTMGDAYSLCDFSVSRPTMQASGDVQSEGFVVLQDTKVALCSAGVVAWGERTEILGYQAYDVSWGLEVTSQFHLRDAVFQVNTSNAKAARWPFDRDSLYDSPQIRGYEAYDVGLSAILYNVSFVNYKSVDIYPASWGQGQWRTDAMPMAIRTLVWSDQYKPDKMMVAFGKVSCTNCDTDTAFIKLRKDYLGSAWNVAMLDSDGTIVNTLLGGTKPSQPYLIASGFSGNWWQINTATSWQEPKAGNAWITPAPAGEAVARLDFRITNSAGTSAYTLDPWQGHGDSVAKTAATIGFVTQFGQINRRLPVDLLEGTTGMTGKTGWYLSFNSSATAYRAPKRLEVIPFNVPVGHSVLLVTCYPPGTTLSVSQTNKWASCQDRTPTSKLPMVKVATRAALVAGGGGNYFVDNSTNCLHLKIEDLGPAWPWTDRFERDGLQIWQSPRWYDYRYVVTATNMPGGTSCNNYFCPLSGAPSTRLPTALFNAASTCTDIMPPKLPPGTPGVEMCGRVRCGWSSYGSASATRGCNHTDIISGGFCKDSCGRC